MLLSRCFPVPHFVSVHQTVQQLHLQHGHRDGHTNGSNSSASTTDAGDNKKIAYSMETAQTDTQTGPVVLPRLLTWDAIK